MSVKDTRFPHRALSEEERALWNAVARAVAPLRRKPLRLLPPSRVDPDHKSKPHRAKASPTSVTRPPAVTKPAALPLMPIDRRLRQRLVRGSAPIDARIDLHGKTQIEAHAALIRFLRKAQAEGAKLVLVITGKGGDKREDLSERGVLKRLVPLWLTLPEFGAYVLGVEQAHISHGGEGALYVRLRKPR